MSIFSRFWTIVGSPGLPFGGPWARFFGTRKKGGKVSFGRPGSSREKWPGWGGAYNESKIGEAELSTLGTPLVLRGTVADIYYIVCIYIYIYMWRTPKQT